MITLILLNYQHTYILSIQKDDSRYIVSHLQLMMAHLYKSTFRFTTLSAFTKDDYRKAKHIISHIIDNPESFSFREPVDWQGLNLIDYPQLIKYPMDLGTVLSKINEEKYQNVEQFLDETELIWDNCKSYNLKGTWIYNLADKLQKNCKKMLRNYFPTIPLQNVKKEPDAIIGKINPTPAPLPTDLNSYSEIVYTPEPISRPAIKSKKSQKQRPYKAQKSEKLYYQDEEEITMEQKMKLADKFKVFSPSQNLELVDYIKNCCPAAYRESDQKVQILVENMDIITFKQILQKVNQIDSQNSFGSKRVKYD